MARLFMPVAIGLYIFQLYCFADGNAQQPALEPIEAIEAASQQPITLAVNLYGQTIGKKVRLRSAPQLDAFVIRELEKGSPLEITAEAGEFYAIKPPFSFKAYVFRTYVLDGKIEGDKVNVRLEPSPQAPILTQLSTGYAIQGKPSTKNSKWLEIEPPENVRFYISRDYVQLVDKDRYDLICQEQAKTKPKRPLPSTPPSDPAATAGIIDLAASSRFQLQEKQLSEQWLMQHAGKSEQDYQACMLESSKWLEGTIIAYEGPEFAPGNFILKAQNRSLGFIYSTTLDLNQYIGAHIRVRVVERDNLGFAYPAFCAIQVQ